MGIDLAALIHPITTEDFFKNYWNKKSLFIKGSKDKFKDLFSWQEINRIAKEHRLQPPQIRLAHEGKSTDELQFLKTRITPRGTTIYSIDIPVLYRLLREGASLVLDAVDEMSPAVSKFCETVGRDFGCQFSVNAYAVWGSDPGFGVHWDDHDLFVVQIDGKKHWRLFGITRPFPMDKDFEQNPFPDTNTFEWEQVIEEGDVIYIPRGHWHGATGMHEPTLHLTCGMNNPTGVDLMTWLVDDLRKEVLIRQDVPRFATNDIKQQYSQALRQLIQERLSEDFLQQYTDFWNGNNQARTNLSLPFGGLEPRVPLDDDFIVAFSGISYTPIKETANCTIIFQAIGKEIELVKDAKSVCEVILKGDPIAATELISMAQGKLNRNAIRKIIDVLIMQGIVYIYRGT